MQLNDARHGFLRVTAAHTVTAVAHPQENAARTIAAIAAAADSDVLVFAELNLTGYTCGDLLQQATLVQAARQAVKVVAKATRGSGQLVVVGLPFQVGEALYNCAAVLADGRCLGIVPKTYLPNYREFYESRWFTAADGPLPATAELNGEQVPFGTDLLFASGVAVIGVEICEDLWMPIPPSSHLALAGATLLLNLSASNETVAKSEYRRQLVAGQSARCLAAYAYASAGPSESTTDIVMGGHNLIAENGVLLTESRRLERGPVLTTADIDVEKLLSERRRATTFGDSAKRLPHRYRTIPFLLREQQFPRLQRTVVALPFVPADAATRNARCEDIFGIQCAGLAKRLERLSPDSPVHLGISGGLDSTLALLVAVKTHDLLGRDRKLIRGLTMPGFGTTDRTRTNAVQLMTQLQISQETIDIRALCLQAFADLGHRPFGLAPEDWGDPDQFVQKLRDLPDDNRDDLVFENVQARMRTFLLMSRGFVIGTGDLSELALGWCTYNGDHMSMYNVNCSIPKTLVQFLVRHVADHEFDGPVRDTLHSIAGTLISPELLPTSKQGEILQGTEAKIGPYELHDFFLFQFVRHGFKPRKILYLAEQAAFQNTYSAEERAKWLRVFLTRFFSQQFKRSCVPDGPKVGSVSLSPRGDWRMPSDADVQSWLDDITA